VFHRRHQRCLTNPLVQRLT